MPPSFHQRDKLIFEVPTLCQGNRGFPFFPLISAVRDMQQMYELWLQLTNQSRRTDSSAVTPPPDEKQVTISADYTESMVSSNNTALFSVIVYPVSKAH